MLLHLFQLLPPPLLLPWWHCWLDTPHCRLADCWTLLFIVFIATRKFSSGSLWGENCDCPKEKKEKKNHLLHFFCLILFSVVEKLGSCSFVSGNDMRWWLLLSFCLESFYLKWSQCLLFVGGGLLQQCKWCIGQGTLLEWHGSKPGGTWYQPWDSHKTWSWVWHHHHIVCFFYTQHILCCIRCIIKW